MEDLIQITINQASLLWKEISSELKLSNQKSVSRYFQKTQNIRC